MGWLVEKEKTIYTGQFSDFKFNGVGQLVEQTGDVYLGDFVNGSKNGVG